MISLRNKRKKINRNKQKLIIFCSRAKEVPRYFIVNNKLGEWVDFWLTVTNWSALVVPLFFFPHLIGGACVPSSQRLGHINGSIDTSYQWTIFGSEPTPFILLVLLESDLITFEKHWVQIQLDVLVRFQISPLNKSYGWHPNPESVYLTCLKFIGTEQSGPGPFVQPKRNIWGPGACNTSLQYPQQKPVTGPGYRFYSKSYFF